MEPQEQQQQLYQQQEAYQYQYATQQSDTISNTTPTSYDPSQIQTYYQSSTQQTYYAYNQQQQQDYSSYYYQTSYQTQNDPNAIYPPGVSIPLDSQQTHLQNPTNFYYAQPPQGYITLGHSAYRGGGSHAGRSMRGSGRGHHGGGRGGGRGKPLTSRPAPAGAVGEGSQSMASSSMQGQATPGKPPSQMAWCELCRVDCNTMEILEQHKNGKKHKKNMKLFEELQNLSRQVTLQSSQMPFQSKPENASSKKPEGSEGSLLTSENATPKPAATENIADAAPEQNVANKSEPSSVALPSEVAARKDPFGGRGGFKRKMRGGRGGKWMRTYDGSRRLVEPPKPKQPIPLFCDLCNVKCESQVVFESHLVGKKHLSNVKRFQSHKEALGEGIKDLYPTIANIPSAAFIPQTNQQTPQDAQALASMMLSQQNLQDPLAAQAALAQLLNQHGIHDTQTLITQLVPYLLAQFQGPGSLPVPVAGLGVDAQNPQAQGAQFSTGVVNRNASAENKTELLNLTANADFQANPGTNGKPDDNQSLHSHVEGHSENNNVGAEHK